MTRRGRAAAVGLALVVAGCTAPAPGAPQPSAPAATPAALEGTLVVLAAASLTDVLTDLAAELEHEHPGLQVETAFGASSTLAAQVVAGAPADVLVTASRATMTTATDAVGGEPVVVARNRLELAVPVGNPGGVRSLADLADPDLTVALCAPEVPCGAVGAQVLSAAGVQAAPDTLERDVRGVLTRLRLDEADAGLVYRTDIIAAAGDVEGIELPDDVQVPTDHPAVVIPDAPHAEAAAAFVALLRGPAGRGAFLDAGFELP
ncbi:molybdate ABC transporter substrate-binding protein [Cellulomonas dongxiuzhuiae]|uniref:Molybdate ABC transporter substrate-binding protein n=1 Tax=Cellulomonas dongxiuzhuiae TaxID=2819979 RepID=A0ABX8GQK1_9CELL|nr:molybdate ABC transporter substrate-binding protein [Cellulomonas dongxiuzhuiae]MBO3093316.1 molybdate ABC transporter substrate-binding protein [Cellulomonas dongxiuzhuiae]QWC17599.1 molybdate ABC transporter substrate-binding protein [Cellulomonas dongxiuzhuiae]